MKHMYGLFIFLTASYIQSSENPQEIDSNTHVSRPLSGLDILVAVVCGTEEGQDIENSHCTRPNINPQ